MGFHVSLGKECLQFYSSDCLRPQGLKVSLNPINPMTNFLADSEIASVRDTGISKGYKTTTFTEPLTALLYGH